MFCVDSTAFLSYSYINRGTMYKNGFLRFRWDQASRFLLPFPPLTLGTSRKNGSDRTSSSLYSS